MQIDIDGSPKGYGHVPIVGPRIVRNVPRLADPLVERFRTAFVPDVSDQVGQLYTMDSYIRPLYQPMKRLVGLALTVKTPPGDNLMIHRAMKMAQAGDVLVIDSRGYAECCGSGAGSLTPAIQRGLAGLVIDGAWRDVVELQALDFPIFGRGLSPYSPPKSRLGEINVPVACGGVIVHPGDVIVADIEGCVVVPRDYAQTVADHLRNYQLANSLDEWDLDRMNRTAAQRAEYEEALFEARGGVYVDWSEVRMASVRRWDAVLAGIVAAAGTAMTTAGALLHMPQLMAPVSALILLGSAWLGMSLALRGVRLFPRVEPSETPAPTERP